MKQNELVTVVVNSVKDTAHDKVLAVFEDENAHDKVEIPDESRLFEIAVDCAKRHNLIAIAKNLGPTDTPIAQLEDSVLNQYKLTLHLISVIRKLKKELEEK